MITRRFRLLMASFALSAASTRPSIAQDTQLPTNYIRVSAPFAQKITVAEMERHANQIQKIGLHAVPPQASDNVIIASNIPSKVGKKSSAPDLVIINAGQPHVLRDEKGKFYDLALPITDQAGRDIGGGLLVMEVPYANATSEQQALQIGLAIRDELKAQIPSKEALFQ